MSREDVATTLWSPGFSAVLGVLQKKYIDLARDATHNSSATEKQHFSTVQQLALLRSIVRDIYSIPNETPPQSIISLMGIKE